VTLLSVVGYSIGAGIRCICEYRTTGFFRPSEENGNLPAPDLKSTVGAPVAARLDYSSNLGEEPMQ